MKALVVEDEFTSREILKRLLAPVFEVDLAVNGQEAVQAFTLAHERKEPYGLVLMDIMMPVVDGLEALSLIRTMEREQGLTPVKVLMTTALNDPKTVIKSFHDGEASGYLIKPIERGKLFAELAKLDLVRT
jgi:two-component system, chemotaxis family, chemotaxis protein CheY